MTMFVLDVFRRSKEEVMRREAEDVVLGWIEMLVRVRVPEETVNTGLVNDRLLFNSKTMFVNETDVVAQ